MAAWMDARASLLTAAILVAGLVAGQASGQSPFVPHPPILVVGDTGPRGLELAPGVPNLAIGVTRGSGTAADPYVIEGWLVTGHLHGSGFHAGIDVHGTTKHLVVRGNQVICLPSSSRCGDGISLFNARNVRLEGNVLDRAGENGLFVGMSFGGGQAHNVHVTGNVVRHTAGPGLFLVRLNNSLVEGNLVADNLAGCECFSIGAVNGVGGTTFRGNDVVRNNYGFFHSGVGTVLAEDNWWGAASGPASCTNPDGEGNAVTCNVDHTPWATERQT